MGAASGSIYTIRQIGKAFAWAQGALGETEIFVPGDGFDSDLSASWNEWLATLSESDRSKVPGPDDVDKSILTIALSLSRSSRPKPFEGDGYRLAPAPAGSYRSAIQLYANKLSPDDWIRLASIYLAKTPKKD